MPKTKNDKARPARGLGSGLDDLFGISEGYSGGITGGQGNTVSAVSLSEIEPNRSQPRKDFGEESLAELAESIKRNGVINPIALRASGNGYIIIAGERRWRAARLAGLDEIPAVIFSADDEKAAEMALIENLQREDLNPIDEAEGIRALIESFNLTQEECAERIGRSRPAITNGLRLLSLDEATLELVRKGELSGAHGRTLLAIRDIKARLSLALRCRDGEWSVRRLEAEVKAMLKAPKEEAESKLDYAAELSERLTKSLGRGVKIVSGRKKGRLEIEYYGNEDLDALIALLDKNIL